MPITVPTASRVRRVGASNVPAVARVLEYDQSIPGRIEGAAKGFEELFFKLQEQRNNGEVIDRVNTAKLGISNLLHGELLKTQGSGAIGVSAVGQAKFTVFADFAVEGASDHVAARVRRQLELARIPFMGALLGHETAQQAVRVRDGAKLSAMVGRENVAASPRDPAVYNAAVYDLLESHKALLLTVGKEDAEIQLRTDMYELNLTAVESLLAAGLPEQAILWLEGNYDE